MGVGWDDEGRGEGTPDARDTDTEGQGEIRVGDGGLGVLPLTVSLEDLRLLKLEARVEVIALNVAFFLGSGSALPLFLS